MKRWLILLAILAATGPAFAHAMLEQAKPAAGAALNKTPKDITLRFSEPLEGAFSTIEVHAGSGPNVAQPAMVHDRTLRAALGPLAPGTYRVSWHAVSIDTHRTEGAYSFTVKP